MIAFKRVLEGYLLILQVKVSLVHLEPCNAYLFLRLALSLGPTLSFTPHLGVFINSMVLGFNSPVASNPANT